MKIAYLSYCIKNNLNNNNDTNRNNDNNNHNYNHNSFAFGFFYLILLFFGFICLFQRRMSTNACISILKCEVIVKFERFN